LPFAGIYTKTILNQRTWEKTVFRCGSFAYPQVDGGFPTEEYCMKENMLRSPLLKAGLVLLVLVLLAYLTSAAPEGGLFSAIGQLFIGVFRLVQWAIAMVIGLTFSIAFLIGIFLLAAFLVNKETAASMYQAVKKSVFALCQPICARFTALGQCKETSASCATPPPPEPLPVEPVAPPVAAATEAPDAHFKEELQAIVADEVRKVTEIQQALSDQLAALAGKYQAMEDKCADFASAGQLGALASELAASGKTLETVQAQVASLEGKIGETVQQLQGITPDKILGDIPARLQQLEQPKEQQPAFDPAPLNASIENLLMEIEELKKRKSSSSPAKTKKKA